MWQKLKLMPPAGAASLHSALAGPVASFSGALSAGREQLQALGLPGGAGGAAPEPEQLAALLAARLNFLAITPYNCGQRVGDQFLLTPEAALARIQQRLSKVAWQGEDALLLLLPALDARTLSTALSALIRVWTTPELEQLLRQCGAWATLESDKFRVPEAAGYPPLGLDGPAEHAGGRELYDLLAAECALAEAAAQASASPAAKLEAFAQERLDKAESVAAGVKRLLEEIQLAAAGFNGRFEFQAAYLAGASSGQISKLKSGSSAAELNKHCAVLCWWGQAENLVFLKELFGV